MDFFESRNGKVLASLASDEHNRGLTMRIAILEDDPSQRELLIHWLTSAGHQAAPFERGDDFLKSDGRPDFEMLILDWNLPDVTGIEVLQRVRKTSKMPVLFCTARTHPGRYREGSS